MSGTKIDRGQLDGLGVVITRPLHQANRLAQLVQMAGGQPLLFPAIEIAPVDDPEALRVSLDRLADYDLALFVSANAARLAASSLPPRFQWPAHLEVVAVGAATRKALLELNIPISVIPQDNYNSESLLKLPALRLMTGKRVVIFRGQDGRELLAQTLIERGAEVDYVQTYQRRLPQTDSKILEPVWKNPQNWVFVVTSNQGLENLGKLVTQDHQMDLLKTRLVGVSARMLELAESMGFERPCQIAARASDDALLEALIELANQNWS